MLLYYTFQDTNGLSFPDHTQKETWSVEFPDTMNINELKAKMTLSWDYLTPSDLKLYEPIFLSLLNEKSCMNLFGSCVRFPLIVSVKYWKTQQNRSPVDSNELPMTSVLHYLLTREKKYKPVVIASNVAMC
jgi:hypothetical protein